MLTLHEAVDATHTRGGGGGRGCELAEVVDATHTRGGGGWGGMLTFM